MAATADDSGGGGGGGGERVKLLCSLGGRILPRPGDGALRYAGGDTRIVSVPRAASFSELVSRLADAYGLAAGHFAIKYQLPDEGLDALISVSSPDDLDNMFDEYDKLFGPSPKLRVFLFPISGDSSAGADPAAAGDYDVGVRYIEAVNGIVRKDSAASLASTQNSDGAPPPPAPASCAATTVDAPSGGMSPAVLSPTSTASNDASRSAFAAAPMPLLAPLVDMQFTHSASAEQCVNPLPISANPALPVESKANANSQENASEVRAAQPQQHTEARYRQPLSQLPPLPPVFLNDHYPPPPVQQQTGNGVRFEDCNMCLKALPHAHSDPAVTDHAEGHVRIMPEPSPVYMSLRPEDVARIMVPERMVAAAPIGAYGFTHVHAVPPRPNGLAPPTGITNSMLIDPASLHQHGFVQQQQHLPSSYGFSHIPVIPHEKERVIPPNTDGLATTAGNAYSMLPDHASSHQQVLQQQQQPQQQLPLTHGLSQYPVKQGAVGNPLLGEGNLSGNARHREDGQLRRDDVPPVAPPTHVANMDRMMDSLRVSPTEVCASPTDPSGSSDQRKHVVSPDSGMPQNVLTEHLQAAPESSFITRSDTRAKEMHQSDAFFDVPEQKLVVPTEPLPTSSMASPYLHNLQPANVTMVSIGGPYPSYLAATVGTAGVPPSSYGIDLAYTNSTMNLASEQKDAMPEIYPKEVLNEVITPPSGNFQVPTAIATSNAANVEQLQESVLPTPQFCNDDPWKILTNTHALPPKPKRVASRDNISPKDPYSNDSLSNSKVPDMNIPADEVPLHHQLDTMNKEPHAEPARCVQGDEVAKQEFHAMEVCLTAPTVQLSEPQPQSSLAHETREPAAFFNEGVGAVSDRIDGEIHTNEVIKSRPADWINPSGFPITDDLGRLQIIKNTDLEELQELGSGTFGTVYHGKWRGSDVAIKRINDRCFTGKPSEQEKMRSDFWNEASKLADLHHPNVVAFYGVVLDGPGGSIATVTEYMVNGSLRQALLKNAKTLDRRKRLIIAMDAAFGMEYLHNKNIVHFDLKSDNLLVNLRDPQRPICKVGDLGLSKVKCQTLISGGVRGTLPWMAPELLNGSSSLVSEKVDVFSFGIVLWELLTGEEPYADLHYGVIIGGIVSNTLRPQVPESCDPEWRSLMEQCWSTEPSDRPTFTEVAGRLRSMASSQKVQS